MYTEEFYMLLSGLSAESRFFMQIADKNSNAAGNTQNIERVQVTNMSQFRDAIGR